MRAIERAISLNPNNALAFGHAGWVHNYSGQPRKAIDSVNQAMRLSPRDAMLYRPTRPGHMHIYFSRNSMRQSLGA